MAKNEKIIDLPEIFSFWVRKYEKNSHHIKLIDTKNTELLNLIEKENRLLMVKNITEEKWDFIKLIKSNNEELREQIK